MKASVYNLPHFRIDYQDWFRGNNVADNYPNGGLLSSETGFNPFKYEGLIVAQKAFPTTTVTSSLKRVASLATGTSVDQGTGAFKLMAIAGLADPNTWGLGRFYIVDPDTAAMTALGAGNTTKHYRRGWSDSCMIGYDTLFTSGTDITKVVMSGGTAASITETWGTSNGMSGDFTENVPHPIIVGDTLAYVGDGNNLTQIDLLSGGTVTKDYFTNIPAEYVVTAGIYHRGYFYLAAAYWYAALGVITNAKTHTRIFLWDGFSQSFADDFYIDDTVTAMHRGSDGTVFVWTTKHFGYLSGSTFIKLRKVLTSVYKCDIIDVPNGVMYAEGTQMIRYSSVVPGGKRAFYLVPFTPGTPDTSFAFTGNSHSVNVTAFTGDVVAATDVFTLSSSLATLGITNGTGILYTGPSHDVFVINTTYYVGNISGSTCKLYSDAGLTTLMNATVDTSGMTFTVPGNNSYVSLSVNPVEYGISAGSAITYTGSTSGGLVNNTVYYAGDLTTSRFTVYDDSGLTTKHVMSADVNPAAFSVAVSGSETITGLAQLRADYPIVFTDHGTPGNGKNLLYGPLDNDTSGTNKTFRFNRRITRVPVKVRGVVIETEGLGASGTITVSYYNSEGTLKSCGTYTYATSKMAARQRWAFEVTGHPTTTEIDPVITISGTAKFKSADFYYERSENDSNT